MTSSANPWLSFSESSIPWPLRECIDQRVLSLNSYTDALLLSELSLLIAELLGTSEKITLLAILKDHGASGLHYEIPRIWTNGTSHTHDHYRNFLVNYDLIASWIHQAWHPLYGSQEQVCTWLAKDRAHMPLQNSWLHEWAKQYGNWISVLPGRAAVSRLTLYVGSPIELNNDHVLLLFYTAQKIAQLLELRSKPYLSSLMAMKLNPRETDVLRAGLAGAVDEEIAQTLGICVDTIRYYYKKFKHRAPQEMTHLRPRELSKVLHLLGKL